MITYTNRGTNSSLIHYKCNHSRLLLYTTSCVILYIPYIKLYNAASAADECSHIIALTSAPMSFVFGIICGLLLYHCGVKCTCKIYNRRVRRCSERAEDNDTNVNLQPDNNEDLANSSNEEEGSYNNALYEEIPDGRHEQSWSFEQNVAYGQFHTVAEVHATS